MLADPSDTEREILGCFTTSRNETCLHTDSTLLPKRAAARASWNYLMTPDRDTVAVTYDVSRLMGLGGPRRFLVTLGGHDYVDPAVWMEKNGAELLRLWTAASDGGSGFRRVVL